MMDYTTQGRSPPSKKAKTKYPKVFQCSGYGDCKMTFTRSEHLARHIRKHTGERPFRCHCNRTFSRLDNLRQHIQTVHANEHHILHAPPPPPLPHSNKVPGQTEYIHRPPQPLAPAQQQYWTGPGAGHKSQHIIIEHNPTSSTSSPSQQQQFQDGATPSQFRPRNNRPNPLSLDQKPSMNYGQDYKQSPTSPMFHLNSPQQSSSMSQAQYHQHIQQQQSQQSQQPVAPSVHQQPWLRNHYSQEQLPSLRNSRSSINSLHSTHSLSQAYPPMPQQPSTPSAHHPSEYPYQTNGFHSSPNLESHSHSHRSTVSSVSSKHLSASSAVTTPITSNTNSWLSNVLCEPAANHSAQQDEERPHTWGPSNNTSQFEDHDRNSLSQLVRITEDAHISTPPNTTPSSEALPSLSALFSGNREQGLTPPQLGQNRSYTKNLILPRPDSYPPKGYTLPMADTRPPALPPAGEQQHAKSPSTPSSLSSGRMNKPLPPLPAEAQRAEKDRVDGINALIRAAGV